MLNRFFWPAVFWTFFITIACLISSESFRNLNGIRIPFKDKYLHCTFYFIFTVLWYLSLRVRNGRGDKKTRLKVFLLAVGYGIIIEICQGAFASGRSADIWDAVANTTGSGLAVLVLWLASKNIKD